METIIKIRRLYYKDKLSLRAISTRLGLNRRTVKKHLTTVEPPKYRRSVKLYPKLGAFIPSINEHLYAESKKPRKERISIRRFFEHLRIEGYTGEYPALCAYIRGFKKQQSSFTQDVFIPQHFEPGEAYQFDWSTEVVNLAGKAIKLKVAHLKLCHSRAFFIKAYLNETMEMLVDAHNAGFAYFGGVCKRGIYDNMKTAVISVGQGKERVWNPQFLGLMNHYLIAPEACNRAAGWEKGQVERQVKTLRKRIFQPVLSLSTLDELNAYLLEQCHVLADQFKHPEQTKRCVADVFKEEQRFFSQCTPYVWYKAKAAHVSPLSLVSYDGHKYSVPCALVGKSVTVQIYAKEIKVVYDGKCVAQHERSFAKNQTSYNPWHYLKALERKPGALRNGEPFLNWVLPDPVKQLQAHLTANPKGDRAFIKLLSLIAEYGEDVGVTAACIALEEKVPTVEAVQNIISRLIEPPIPELKVKEIPLHCPPQGNCERYNSLLTKGAIHATS